MAIPRSSGARSGWNSNGSTPERGELLPVAAGVSLGGGSFATGSDESGAGVPGAELPDAAVGGTRGASGAIPFTSCVGGAAEGDANGAVARGIVSMPGTPGIAGTRGKENNSWTAGGMASGLAVGAPGG
ncbi:MAG TPA: hypothetical protein VN924_12090 [Bryobacteraceae bacterium]|nr:hypothetical protein [Bryobacteraceae bacterium]